MTTPAPTRGQVVERVLGVGERILAPGVRRISLFGSFVREEARPDSDVDLLVEFDPERKTFDGFTAPADFPETAPQSRSHVSSC